MDLLRDYDSSHIKIFGGGGGVIVAEEIKELEDYGVTKIYSPEDGRKWGLQGMINHFLKNCDFPTADASFNGKVAELGPQNWRSIANIITAMEVARESGNGDLPAIPRRTPGEDRRPDCPCPRNHGDWRRRQVVAHGRDCSEVSQRST